jgi:hypothetical protein
MGNGFCRTKAVAIKGKAVLGSRQHAQQSGHIEDRDKEAKISKPAGLYGACALIEEVARMELWR